MISGHPFTSLTGICTHWPGQVTGTGILPHPKDSDRNCDSLTKSVTGNTPLLSVRDLTWDGICDVYQRQSILNKQLLPKNVWVGIFVLPQKFGLEFFCWLKKIWVQNNIKPKRFGSEFFVTPQKIGLEFFLTQWNLGCKKCMSEFLFTKNNYGQIFFLTQNDLDRIFVVDPKHFESEIFSDPKKFRVWRWPKQKMTKMEDDQYGKCPKWKMTKM